MKISDSELEILKALIGQKPFCIFCPCPSVFESHIESSSYTFWQNNKADFISIYIIEKPDGGTVHVERAEKPYEVNYDRTSNCLSECTDIILNKSSPITKIHIYGESDNDFAVEMVGSKGSLLTIYLDFNDLSFYRYKASFLKEADVRVTISA